MKLLESDLTIVSHNPERMNTWDINNTNEWFKFSINKRWDDYLIDPLGFSRKNKPDAVPDAMARIAEGQVVSITDVPSRLKRGKFQRIETLLLSVYTEYTKSEAYRQSRIRFVCEKYREALEKIFMKSGVPSIQDLDRETLMRIAEETINLHFTEKLLES